MTTQINIPTPPNTSYIYRNIIQTNVPTTRTCTVTMLIVGLQDQKYSHNFYGKSNSSEKLALK